jgi:asparagine synthase (glutamine-hydrolysing)
MSVQFGRWSFEGQPAGQEYLGKVREMLAPYGPDAAGAYSQSGVDILYFGFHTTRESSRETQPCRLKSGAVLAWDGRLDNRAEFIGLLGEHLRPDSADAAIVAAAYERWGSDCFAQLIGDWALAIWDPRAQSLLLAKDVIGTRPLYYAADAGRIAWSTLLDPLVFLAGRRLALEEEYLAGWLGAFPATHLTPYRGISSVPPASFVRLSRGRNVVEKYWDFDPTKKIRYKSDAEYEEHFRRVFRDGVRRRLRSESPVLAELSGGMDSSAIVCMADALLAEGCAETPRLDTISFYDDSEPNWNERPYFTKIEEKRGRTGCHIDARSMDTRDGLREDSHIPLTPGSGRAPCPDLVHCMTLQGNRVVLSGVGGDEVTGGVPTPLPELADLLASGHLIRLARQLKAWALEKRKPWFHLFWEAARAFLPSVRVSGETRKRRAAWLDPRFARLFRAGLCGYEPKLKFPGPRPSFQENLHTLETLRRQLGSAAIGPEPLAEKRYPYLDRDLLEFLFAVPREQLVGPGERRRLMRRALTGLVPAEILTRRRKAFVARKPILDFRHKYQYMLDAGGEMASASIGVINQPAFQEAFAEACRGRADHMVGLMRTLAIELWLREIGPYGILSGLRWNENQAKAQRHREAPIHARTP